MVDPKARFVGKTLHDVPTPCAVLDLAKLEVNCQQMLDTVDRLSLLWRPHIKTHKVRWDGWLDVHSWKQDEYGLT